MTNTKMHSYRVSIMQAWQNTLTHSIQSTDIFNETDNLSLLNRLPIFAAIIVLKTSKKDQLKASFSQWIETQTNSSMGWSATDVNPFDKSDPQFITDTLAGIDILQDKISQVSVLRYVLSPCQTILTKNISADEYTEIMQTLYQQITQYLTQDLSLKNSDFDCHLLPISYLLQTHKMACFDMDSTLITQEVIVELAKATGIGERVNEITESAMRGEIDFNESFTQRLGLLKGTQADVLADINESLTLSAGAKTTLTLLNAMGYHTVLVSGGFGYFAKQVASKLCIDEFHANTLMIQDDHVTGDVVLPIVDGKQKAHIITEIAQQQGIELSEVICIGDGANDLAMMAKANLGFAYQAKPIVQAKADLAINCTGLEGVLYGLGYGAISS